MQSQCWSPRPLLEQTVHPVSWVHLTVVNPIRPPPLANSQPVLSSWDRPALDKARGIATSPQPQTVTGHWTVWCGRQLCHVQCSTQSEKGLLQQTDCSCNSRWGPQNAPSLLFVLCVYVHVCICVAGVNKCLNQCVSSN